MLTEYQKFFTSRPTTAIAQDLLGRPLVYEGPQGKTGGWIVETEAYLGVDDTASHAYQGRRTGYTESLYGDPGDIYLYQIRGRYCFDIVVQDRDNPQGILIRAIEPGWGQDIMQANRGKQRGVNLTNGPAKLVQALGIGSRGLDGQPMESSPLHVVLDPAEKRQPKEILTTARIGVNLNFKNGKSPRRFIVAKHPFVSKIVRKETDRISRGWG